MAHPILVPPLGQTTDTVILSAWHKQPGQPVKVGEPLFAIETDKATLDIEAQDAGILAQVSAQAGDEVKVLSSIGLIAAPGELVSVEAEEQESKGEREPGREDEQAEQGSKGAGRQESRVAEKRDSRGTEESEERGEGERVFISPRARRLALAESVRWEHVTGTGPEGAIVERDIRQYIAQINSARPELPGQVLTYAISPAQQAQTLTTQADVSALIELRERYARRELAVSLESILVYILARVAQETPSVVVAPEDLTIGYVTPGQGGFVMPILSHLSTKGLLALTHEMGDVAVRAQAGDLQSAEVTPTITFTSLAALGIDLFTPVVEAPGILMLGVGRVHQYRSGEQLAWFSLNYTGTRLDASAAAQLLGQIVERVEDPDMLF